MMKKTFLNDPTKRDQALRKVMQVLEAISWLYNCKKVQLEMGTIPDPYPDQLGYWQINRFKKFYLGKSIEQHMKSLSAQAQELICDSNRQSWTQV